MSAIPPNTKAAIEKKVPADSGMGTPWPQTLKRRLQMLQLRPPEPSPESRLFRQFELELLEILKRCIGNDIFSKFCKYFNIGLGRQLSRATL
jgi:hypothetical protein